MAVVNVKSTAISNADATPRIANSPYIDSAMKRAAVGKASIAAADSVGSTYRMARIPSSARIVSFSRTNGASGATGQVDVGLYRTAADGGAVVDSDILHNEMVLESAGNNVVAGQVAAGDKEKRLWELLGLTADPGVDYDVTLTLTEVCASGIDVAIDIEYVL